MTGSTGHGLSGYLQWPVNPNSIRHVNTRVQQLIVGVLSTQVFLTHKLCLLWQTLARHKHEHSLFQTLHSFLITMPQNQLQKIPTNNSTFQSSRFSAAAAATTTTTTQPLRSSLHIGSLSPLSLKIINN